MDAVVLTAAYAEALQLERFFVTYGGDRPLLVFSHRMRLTRVPA